MAAAIIMIAFILLFVGTIVLIQFPAVATEIYTVASSFMTFLGNSTGLLWFFCLKLLL